MGNDPKRNPLNLGANLDYGADRAISVTYKLQVRAICHILVHFSE